MSPKRLCSHWFKGVSGGKRSMGSLTPTREKILAAAVAAPSADNSQPWQLRWRGGALELWIDEERSGHDSDSSYLLSDLALGACIENICIQASALGYASHVTLIPELDHEPRKVAIITWSAAPKLDVDLAAVIPCRHTDRRFPWGPVTESSVVRLQSVGIDDGTARIQLIPAGEARARASRILMRAEGLRFSSRTLHAELFRAIRFDVGWHQTCAEGLAPGTLFIERLLRLPFTALQYWPVMRSLNVLGAASMLAWRGAYLPVSKSPLLFLLTAESLQRSHVLASGRLLERFWLRATALGLAVQPFAALGAAAYGTVPIESRLERRRQSLKASVESISKSGVGLIFLRVGQADASRPPMRNARREVVDLLMDA